MQLPEEELGSVYGKCLGNVFKDDALKQAFSEILFKGKVIEIYSFNEPAFFVNLKLGDVLDKLDLSVSLGTSLVLQFLSNPFRAGS